MELLADTGLATDVVYLESIRINYTRQLKVLADQLRFTLPADTAAGPNDDRLFANDFSDEGSAACASGPGCAAWRVTGLYNSEVTLLRKRAGQVERLAGARVSPSTSGGFELTFASTTQAGDLYWIQPNTGAGNLELIPSSAAELAMIVQKTLAYAQSATPRRLLLQSDRDEGTLSYRNQLGALRNQLGQGWASTALSLQDYPPGGTAQARTDLVAAVNSGQSLVAFLGHSAHSTWARESLITAPQVYAGLFNNVGRPTVILGAGLLQRDVR